MSLVPSLNGALVYANQLLERTHTFLIRERRKLKSIKQLKLESPSVRIIHRVFISEVTLKRTILMIFIILMLILTKILLLISLKLILMILVTMIFR